jgi:MFS family permease
MITATYGAAGLLLAIVAVLFGRGSLDLTAFKICFSIILFIASSAASAAYLTVSEIFPLEIRAFAIAIFYALGTFVGGVGAPLLFGFLIASGSQVAVAAGKSLESVSRPLQSAE